MSTNQSEAPCGKPRGNLLRPDALRGRDYAGRVFAEPCDLSGEALAKTEAKNAISSSIAASATEDPPCGKPQGFLAKKGEKMGASRQRMLDAFEYKHPDKIPVVYAPSPAGLFVHGQKLIELFNEFPPDNPIVFNTIPHPPPQALDKDGRYHEFKKDEWGVEWECIIFGVQGHPHKYPFPDWEASANYEFPAISFPDKSEVEELRRNYLVFSPGMSIFERLHALRPIDETLIALLDKNKSLMSFLDRLVDYWLAAIENHIAAGVDVFIFGDDWGTQAGPIISPKLFRKIFKPHYKLLFDAIHKSGRKVFLHSCGYFNEILDELLGLGINGLWPQIPLWENDPAFFERCKEHKVVLYLQPDRQRLIPLGTPKEIETVIRRYAERHRRLGGGGIFFIEIENDAPFENVESLVKSAHKYR